MSTRRSIAAALAVVLLFGTVALVGCSSETQNATFVGYKMRPSDENPDGIAIVRLENGESTEAECEFVSLENGTPVQVEKSGDSYKVVSSSPDWEP